MAIFLLAPTAVAYQLNPAIPTRSCVRLSASDDEASGAAALDPRVAELAPPEAHERMQAGGARLLDVREPAAFALAHVPGAESVPAGEASPGGAFFRFHADFADHVAQLPATPDSALILACDAGAVSRVACGRLIDAGYELPYVSHNPTARINFRRVSSDELTTNGSVRLQRKICRLMLADYCCLGYPFPAACDYQGLC